MPELSDIIPVKSIYFGSGFAVLVWIVPYALGSMVYHWLSRHRVRASGWLLLVLLVPSFVLARIFAWGLDEDLYRPRTSLMAITCVVMLGQALFWGLLLNEYRTRRETGSWRSVANTAFIVSIILALLSLGSFILEKRYRYLEGVRLSRLAVSDQTHLEDVGYAAYPLAEYPFGECMIRSGGGEDGVGGHTGKGYSACGDCLGIHFNTPDESARVLNFYKILARSKGLMTWTGASRASGMPAMVAFSDDHTSIVIEELKANGDSDANDWGVTVYWNTPPDFGFLIALSFDLSGP